MLMTMMRMKCILDKLIMEGALVSMKKIIGVIIAIVGIIIAGFGISMKQKEAMAISIIGGADGPTSVFLAGKLGTTSFLAIIVVAVVLLAVRVAIIVKKKK